jgi:hypothetical protein
MEHIILAQYNFSLIPTVLEIMKRNKYYEEAFELSYSARNNGLEYIIVAEKEQRSLF